MFRNSHNKHTRPPKPTHVSSRASDRQAPCQKPLSSFHNHILHQRHHNGPSEALYHINKTCEWNPQPLTLLTAEFYYCGADPADWPRGKLWSKHGPSQVPLVIFIMVQFELHYQVGTGNNIQDSVQVTSGRWTAASLFSACWGASSTSNELSNLPAPKSKKHVTRGLRLFGSMDILTRAEHQWQKTPPHTSYK